MDPLTAIGAVASICQLAQTALSLSKTLYSLGSALSSASEDIQILADDLKTFAQSLTLLSRLLEDSKSWYSDDIYLLTAKIIKDCAELYIKIDKILTKLGGNGKSNWKLRVKFVYKEGEIRKLLKRLRDMKGTLATILMSLQVDLQLSLLNISSSSSLSSNKTQRGLETQLQPETVETLKEAQRAVESGGFLPKYTAVSEKVVEISDEEVRIPTIRSLQVTPQPSVPSFCALSTPSQPMRHGGQQEYASGLDNRSAPFITTQSFMMIPPKPENMPPVRSRPALSRASIDDEKTHPEASSTAISMASHEAVSSIESDLDVRSLKSSSSVESFKSAKSIQDAELEVARKVKAVQSVMHAFRTALQILNNLVEQRIPDKDGDLYSSARNLEETLDEGKDHIDHKHICHFKHQRHKYLAAFTDKHSTKIQDLGSNLMQDVVMKLHEFSAEHEVLVPSGFETLSASTDKITQTVTEYLDFLSNSISSFDPQYTCGAPQAPISHGPMPHLTLAGGDTEPQLSDTPEMSLPFIGYTFKRVDNYAGIRGRPCEPEPVALPRLPSPSSRRQYTRISPETPSQRTKPGNPQYPSGSQISGPTSLMCVPTSPRVEGRPGGGVPTPHHYGIYDSHLIQRRDEGTIANDYDSGSFSWESELPTLEYDPSDLTRPPLPLRAHGRVKMPPLISDSHMPFHSDGPLKSNRPPPSPHSTTLSKMNAPLNGPALPNLIGDQQTPVQQSQQQHARQQIQRNQAQQRSDVYTSEPPAAPTSSQLPYPMQATSWSRTPTYASENTLTEDTLHIPRNTNKSHRGREGGKKYMKDDMWASVDRVAPIVKPQKNSGAASEFGSSIDFQSMDFANLDSGNMDVLQDFDFDSFLHEDGERAFDLDADTFLQGHEIRVDGDLDLDIDLDFISAPTISKILARCESCRTSNSLECDGAKPSCSRCLGNGKDCAYAKAEGIGQRVKPFRPSSSFSSSFKEEKMETDRQPISMDMRDQNSIALLSDHPELVKGAKNAWWSSFETSPFRGDLNNLGQESKSTHSSDTSHGGRARDRADRGGWGELGHSAPRDHLSKVNSLDHVSLETEKRRRLFALNGTIERTTLENTMSADDEKHFSVTDEAGSSARRRLKKAYTPRGSPIAIPEEDLDKPDTEMTEQSTAKKSSPSSLTIEPPQLNPLSERRREILAKKAKLAELKRLRERRQLAAMERQSTGADPTELTEKSQILDYISAQTTEMSSDQPSTSGEVASPNHRSGEDRIVPQSVWKVHPILPSPRPSTDLPTKRVQKSPAGFLCEVEGCEKRFTRRYSLEGHINKTHSNQEDVLDKQLQDLDRLSRLNQAESYQEVSSKYESKLKQAQSYQEDVAEDPFGPLTAEVLKRQQRRQGGRSRSTGNEEEKACLTSGDVRAEIRDQANLYIPVRQQSAKPIDDHLSSPPAIGHSPSNLFGGIIPDPARPAEHSSFFSVPDQPAVIQHHALQDYQMQLMLLEQREKKSKVKIEQEKDLIDTRYRPGLSRAGGPEAAPPTPPSPTPAKKASGENTSQTASGRNNCARTAIEYHDDMSLLSALRDDRRDISRNSIDEAQGWQCAPRDSMTPEPSAPCFSKGISPTPGWLKSKPVEEQGNFDMSLSALMQTPEQHNDDRSTMSKNEQTANEAITILLKLEPTLRFKSPVQTSESDKMALADCQMSLLTGLNCRHNPKRLKMYRTDGGENIPARSQIPSGPSLSPGGDSRAADFAVSDDALNDFDFDSFLQQSGDDDFNFDSYTLSKQRQAVGDEQNRLLPPTNSKRKSNDRTDSPEHVEDKPLFVNKKQFDRILKRRVVRLELEQRLAPAKPPTTLVRDPTIQLTAEMLKQQQQRVSGTSKSLGGDESDHKQSLQHPKSGSGGISRSFSKDDVEERSSSPHVRFVIPEVDIDEDTVMGNNESPKQARPISPPFGGSGTSRGTVLNHPPISTSSRALDILAEECNASIYELKDNLTFIALGVDDLKAMVIRTRLRDSLGIYVQPQALNPEATIGTFRDFLSHSKFTPAFHEETSPSKENSVETPSSENKDIELAWSLPALSPAQTSRLWWQTYISIAKSSPQSHIFTDIKIQLELQLGLVASQYMSDEDICKHIVDNVRPLSIAGSTLHEDRPELRDILFLRGETVRILMTVHQKLGLGTATLGWGCVAVFLSIFAKSINASSTLDPSTITLLEKSFTHLQEIVSIIARYAVMENLYQQSISSGTKTTLSLKPEYESSLLLLCSLILEWFSVSYSVGLRIDSARSGEVEGVDEVMGRCEGLIGEIREGNRACRIFRVEVDVQEQESEGEESPEVDTEDDDKDASDGSWEAIDEAEINVGVGGD